VQPGAVGEPGVHVRRRVVQPATARGGQPLREPAHIGGVAQQHRCPRQAGSPVDPHVDAVDQDVRDARIVQERGQRAGADEVAAHPVGQP
jgi:hypothetical protein